MSGNSLLFLGTGASAGVPVIGSTKFASGSPSPFDKRLRCSALLKINGKVFLIDCGPDFRQQALTHQIRHLNGVIITHTHFDHIAGIDDLRVFYFLDKRKVPCLVSQETLSELKLRYNYLFGPAYENHSIGAQLEFFTLEKDYGSVNFQGEDLGYVSYLQSGMKVIGIRYQDFAYITDIKDYKEEIFSHLQGVKTLVVSAVRLSSSPLHLSVDEAIDFARKVGAKQTYLTHISHEIVHEDVSRGLPEGIALSYDGLEITL